MVDQAVKKYLSRRNERLAARGYRKDDEAENTTNNNNNNRRRESSGGHGNTRLPYGLCQRYGIEIGRGWTPRDAWAALAGKGITPAGEYAKLGGASPTIKMGQTEYKNISARKSDDKWGRYYLEGDLRVQYWGDPHTERAEIASFVNRDELMAFLQEKGVKRFKDPDTGKMMNPMDVKVPDTVAKVGEKRYTDIVLGLVRGYGGPFSGKYISVTGKGFSGLKDRLKVLKTPEQVAKYLESIGCKPEDARKSSDYKKYVEGAGH